MNDVAELLCVVVSVTGGIYCVSLLRNSRKTAGAPGEAVKSLSRSARRKSVCARFNRYCQVLLASAFLAAAATLLAGFAYRELSLLWKEAPLDEQLERSSETLLITGYPPVIVKYDSTQPDSPVFGIECHSKLISDDQVRRLLRQAPRLDYLNLAFTDVSDDALCDLSGTPGLRTVCVSGTRVGDLGLRHLTKLKNLEVLYLGGTKVTDDGLRCLADVRSLRKLSLRNTAVTDAGLEWLGSLDRLEELLLANPGVTNEGVSRLKNKRPGVVVFGQWDRAQP